MVKGQSNFIQWLLFHFYSKESKFRAEKWEMGGDDKFQYCLANIIRYDHSNLYYPQGVFIFWSLFEVSSSPELHFIHHATAFTKELYDHNVFCLRKSHCHWMEAISWSTFYYLYGECFYRNAFWCSIWYSQTSNIRRTSLGNTFVDHSDVVGASPVGAAPTAS